MSPLDGIVALYDPPAETRPDLSMASLEALAWVLRHPAEWPLTTAGRPWEWNFAKISNECGTAGCALGIVGCRWFGGAGLVDRSWAENKGMSAQKFNAVFCHGQKDPSISPAVVADRIDDYLAGRPVRYLVAGDRS